MEIEKRPVDETKMKGTPVTEETTTRATAGEDAPPRKR